MTRRVAGVLGVCGFVLGLSAGNLGAEEKAAREGSDEAIEIVVTASRGAEQPALDVPQAVSVRSKAEIEDTSYIDVDDAMRDMPGVGLAPTEGNPNYWQEGFTLRGLGAQRVLALTDGVRQAGQGMGYGGGNLSLYDPYSIERIEVLRGPASVLYGTDAFGGVVNVITREPRHRDQFGVGGGTRYTFDGSRDAHRFGAYSDVGDKDYGLVLGLGYTNSQEPNLPADVDPQSGSFREWNFSGKFNYRSPEDVKFRLIGNLDRFSDILVIDSVLPLPIATFPPPGASETIVSPLYFTLPIYQRSLVGSEMEFLNLGEAIDSVKTGVYWQHLSREFHRETAFYSSGGPGFAGPPLFFDPQASVNRSVTDTDDRTDTLEWQTQLRSNIEDHVIMTGFDLGYDDARFPESELEQVVGQAGVGSVVGPSSVSERVRADANQIRLGLFAQDTWSLGRFDVIPGARVDYFGVNDDQSDFDDDEFGASGSLGTLYRVSQEQSLYSTLATGFRAPDLGERFQDAVVNLGTPTRLLGNPDLDPERAYTAELGYKQRDRRWSFDVAAYYTRVNDYIGRVGLGVIDGYVTEQFSNLGQVNLYGGEVAVSYGLLDNLDVFFNTSRTWTGEDEKLDVADFIFNYGVRYELPVQTGYIESVTPAVIARSGLESEQKTVVPGRVPYDGSNFTVVDLELVIKLVRTALGNAKILGGVRNIFDENYQEPFFAMPQPGLNGYVALQVDF